MPPDFKTAVKQEEAYLQLTHPTPEDIPSCMSLFDDFLRCHGTPCLSSPTHLLTLKNLTERPPSPSVAVIRAQVVSLYRYGKMTECTQKLEDFKFCMSSKGMHPEEKRDAWIRRRAEWWANRRLAKSSEDVWDVRTEPLKDYPKPPPTPTLGGMEKTNLIS
ncbi:hypothetical protein BXZ70DRAFT_1003512 [Cristinia sonorae]|uniref:Uncharacterized protein n=1 Tax=Cristinia sonorae TaxID=1940300 RepID=A0A8K0XVE9_9AGAR|nr:hypothetical protein BXZ70DRAFT_1003512 [Cristinia sonorae]